MYDNNYTTIISGDDRWKGPGHNSEIITDDNGDDWLLYHSYDRNNNFNGRLMLLDKITWSTDGWPSVNDGHPSSDERDAPVFYTGDGANISYRFANLDLSKSNWAGWVATCSENCTYGSGGGSAFMPLGYVKLGGGTFDVSQSITGQADGLYELYLQNYAKEGGVDLYVNDVATPAFIPSTVGITPPSSETVVSSNFLRANSKYGQTVYGLVVGGKLTIGMRSRGELSETDRFYAGGLKVIYRSRGATANPEALTSVLNSYYAMAEEAIASTGKFYTGYTTNLRRYRETAAASEDAAVRYEQLLQIHKTLDSIKTSVVSYEKLTREVTSMSAQVEAAQAGSYSSPLAESTLQEAQTVLNAGSYTNEQLSDLITRMQAAVHGMLYAYQKGDGSATNPYVISRPEQLDYMHDVLVREQMVYFVMDADVDMTGFVWKQLNTSDNSNRYWINFDGRGHIIKNLTPDGSKYYPSFFGTMCGELRNVGFVDYNVTATSSGAGVVCGYMGHSTFKDAEGNMYPVIVENCYFTGNIVSKGYVGTIGGTLNNSPIIIRNCYSAVNITGNGGSANYSGGLVGRVRTDLTMQRSYAAGAINSPIAGGIVAGGQGSTTPGSVYENVIAWNPTVAGTGSASAFGATTEADLLQQVYYFADMQVNDSPVSDGKTHQELRDIARTWGSPWYADPSAGNGYPILQWQYDRGDYRQICGFEFKDDETSISILRPVDQQGPLFDLSGRQVQQPRRGIYIRNGKKVLFP